MHNLFTNTANIQGGVLSKKYSETFKHNPWKMPKKKLIFSKVARSKNEFIPALFKVFAKSLSNLVHDFCEGFFSKQKLLLAVDRLIYVNVSIGISKIHYPSVS